MTLIKGYSVYGTGLVSGRLGSNVAALLDKSALIKPDVMPVPQEKKTSKVDQSFALMEGEGQEMRRPDEP